jgi:alkylation response protein AidB-like acyl-CoA dehydrogenase
MARESGKSLDKLRELRRKQEYIVQMGGSKAIEERHKKRQISARERIDYFFDSGTFTEIGLLVKHRTAAFGMDKREVPAEGVVTGFGKVNVRHVVVAAEDYTAMAGTFGEYHGRKFARAIDFARDNGWPSEGLPCAREVAIAKAWISEASERVFALAHQIHGAIGVTIEHDLHYYTRRAKAAELAFGDADFYRKIVANEMGL